MQSFLLDALKRPLLAVAGFSVIVNLLLLVPAVFILQVFDRVLTSRSQETLLVLIAAVLIAFAMMMIFDYLRSRLQGVIGNMVAEALSPIVARLMISRSARLNERTGAEAMRDVATLRNLFSAQGLLALIDTPWAIVFVVVIWLAHPALGVAALVSALMMLALAITNDLLTRRRIEALQQEAGKVNRYFESSMQNAEVAHALGMGNALIDRWRKLNASVAALQRPMARRTVSLAAVTRMFRQAVQVAMQALGAYLVITGDATAGVMVATTILLGRALAPVEQIVGSWNVLAEGRLAYRRLNELLKQEGQRVADPMPLPAPTGRLQVQGLAYRPPRSERLILGGLSFGIEAGESLAIIGPSGAGKSTLVRLLIGVWTPSAGDVRLDGVEYAQWKREALGPHVGYLPQAIELFGGSVAENIARMGTVDAEKVVAAAKLAHVHDMILALPEGYDTLVDPGSPLLSPGQRQRIALARAVYGEPKLVVLDEPNSNLDGAGEAALAELLRTLRGRATVVVVTHRTPLVQHVDKLLVMEAGRIQQFGPVTEVMAAMQRAAGKPAGPQVVSVGRPAPAQGAGA